MATADLASVEVADPRVRRTRQSLHAALAGLLREKAFDRISVQEIADAADVNRVTFYDHYADKYLLLNDMVAARFDGLLQERGVEFPGGCARALMGVAVAVCDTLASMPGVNCEERQQMEPHFEAAIIAVVRRMVLRGVREHPPAGDATPEMVATAVSWAIYGAAREWVRSPERASAACVAATIVGLVAPMLTGGTAPAEHRAESS